VDRKAEGRAARIAGVEGSRGSAERGPRDPRAYEARAVGFEARAVWVWS
jgi:hypothetical protein